MLVHRYGQVGARELAAAVVAGAASAAAPRRPAAAAHVLATGGGWDQSTWREGLRRAHAHRGQLAAVGLRTHPDDPILADSDWAGITDRLIDHADLCARPWVAARTGIRSVVVLVAAAVTELPWRTAGEFIAAVRAAYGMAATPAADEPRGPDTLSESTQDTPSYPSADQVEQVAPPGRPDHASAALCGEPSAMAAHSYPQPATIPDATTPACAVPPAPAPPGWSNHR